MKKRLGHVAAPDQPISVKLVLTADAPYGLASAGERLSRLPDCGDYDFQYYCDTARVDHACIGRESGTFPGR